MAGFIESFTQWVEVNSVLCWIAIYLLVMFVLTTFGKVVVGSYRFGLLSGLALVNAISVVWATGLTATQPLWITVCVLLLSLAIAGGLIFLRPGESVEEKE